MGINRDSEQYSGLVAWWPSLASGGGRDTRLVDVVGPGTMSQSGAPVLGRGDSILGPNVAIGTGNYLTGSDANLPSGSSARTIAQWFKLDAIPSVDQYTFTYGSLVATQWFTMGIYGGAGGNQWIVSNAAAAGVSSGYTVAAGSIYHVVFTNSVALGSAFYVNGVPVTLSGVPATFNTVLSSVSFSNYQALSASVFESRVYSRVLSAAEVGRLYDHRTRFDLYRLPSRFARKSGSAGGVTRFRRTAFLRAGSRGFA